MEHRSDGATNKVSRSLCPGVRKHSTGQPPFVGHRTSERRLIPATGYCGTAAHLGNSEVVSRTMRLQASVRLVNGTHTCGTATSSMNSSPAVNHSCINLHYFTLKTDVYLVLPMLSIFVVFKTTGAKRWCFITAILRFAHPPVRSLRCSFAAEASPRRGALDKDGQMMRKHTNALSGTVRKPKSCNAFFYVRSLGRLGRPLHR